MENSGQLLAIGKTVEEELGFTTAGSTMEGWKTALAGRINDLIIHDFERLVRALYRLDINESVLRQELAQTPEDAGLTIADLIIERQLQKWSTRKAFRQDYKDTDECERW